MGTKHIDQQHVKETNGQTEKQAEPKGQDIMKANAEGAGSEAGEFAEGNGTSTTAEPGNANGSANSETTIRIP
jgi:hypothetical protein